MSKVFAQKNKENEWASIPVFTAVKAFNERGYEIVPYQYENVNEIQISSDDIIVGGVSCVRNVLSRYNIKIPDLSIPDKNLEKYYKREFGLITVEEINKSFYKEDYKKIFAKPYNDHKNFNGHVIENFKDLYKTMHLPPETKVVYSTFVEFKSEYRIFVTNGTIVGMSHYCGDPLLFPNKEIIMPLVKDAYEIYSLEGFSIDVGITSENKTLLVEINDGFSLGVYGLNYFIYSKLIEERWKQLVENIK